MPLKHLALPEWRGLSNIVCVGKRIRLRKSLGCRWIWSHDREDAGCSVREQRLLRPTAMPKYTHEIHTVSMGFSTCYGASDTADTARAGCSQPLTHQQWYIASGTRASSNLIGCARCQPVAHISCSFDCARRVAQSINCHMLDPVGHVSTWSCMATWSMQLPA